MQNLAVSYAALNRHADALKLREEVLRLRQAKLGIDSRDTLVSMHCVAKSYADLGRHADAVKLYEQALPLRQFKAGRDDVGTLDLMYDLANSYLALGRHPDAIKLFEETLALRTAKLGRDDIGTLDALYRLATSYVAAGRYGEALKHHEESLALCLKKFGPDRGNTLRSMYGVVYCLVKLKRGAEAVPIIDDLVPRAVRTGTQPLVISSLFSCRMEHFVRIKDVSGCRATAEMWEKLGYKDGVSLYNAACRRALIAAVIVDNAKSATAAREAEAEADRAMALLKQAVAAGFTDIAHIKSDTDLNVLHGRADFKHIVAELEARKDRKKK
jgi:tetratricopeptide (TPR) repeat protein